MRAPPCFLAFVPHLSLDGRTLHVCTRHYVSRASVQAQLPAQYVNLRTPNPPTRSSAPRAILPGWALRPYCPRLLHRQRALPCVWPRTHHQVCCRPTHVHHPHSWLCRGAVRCRGDAGSTHECPLVPLTHFRVGVGRGHGHHAPASAGQCVDTRARATVTTHLCPLQTPTDDRSTTHRIVAWYSSNIEGIQVCNACVSCRRVQQLP